MSAKTEDFIRVAAVSPDIHIGNVGGNLEEITKTYEKYCMQADVLVTPELSLTGYTCADLFTNRRLLETSRAGMETLAELTGKYGAKGALLVVGAPVEAEGELFNCGVCLHDGRIVAIIPKTYLPNYGEFYEKRWFSAGQINQREIYFSGKFPKVPFGNNILLWLPEFDVKIGVEICEDAWAPISPGRLMAVNGAEVILNLSASNEVIGKEAYRRTLFAEASASGICAYVYASAGRQESTSDVVFSGHKLVYEKGRRLAETKPFEEKDILCDINLTKLRHDRLANKSFADCRRNFGNREYVSIACGKEPADKTELLANISITPFVPKKNVLERCQSIFNMQVAGLMRRIETTGCKHIVVGVSGGLDSTLALLVSAQSVKNLGLPSETVIGITMPGFGTTHRTKSNAVKLMELLGCEVREISIVDSVRQHFKDIGHDESVQDITYENCQARERTQILMDVANKENGFVVGTGDLSELALGWCTYNGDHMSMYGVNTSIPKTLVRTLVDEVGHDMDANGFAGMKTVIEDIMDTPVSPELLPPNPDGTIAQKTEDTVGSYILHDFFMYYTLRYGMSPEQIERLCMAAVQADETYCFSREEVRHWLKVFYTRFFRQQFKRNCMPDGVKVGTVSVSPRGDLRLPSEIEIAEFVEDIG